MKSDSAFRPNRRPWKAPQTQKAFPSLKRIPPSSSDIHSSFPSSNKVSKVACDLKFYADSCAFPSSAIITSDDAKTKKIKETKKKKTSNLEKKDFNISTIFSSLKKSSATFRGILKRSTFTSHPLLPYENNKFNISSEHLVSRFKCSPEQYGHIHETNGNVSESMTSDLISHTSFKTSSRNIHESKFEHVKNSRFVSTSFIFRKRDTSSKENVSSSTSETHSSPSKCSNHHEKPNPYHPPSNSSSSYPPTTEEGTSDSHNASKEIKGPNKTLDSLH